MIRPDNPTKPDPKPIRAKLVNSDRLAWSCRAGSVISTYRTHKQEIVGSVDRFVVVVLVNAMGEHLSPPPIYVVCLITFMERSKANHVSEKIDKKMELLGLSPSSTSWLSGRDSIFPVRCKTTKISQIGRNLLPKNELNMIDQGIYPRSRRTARVTRWLWFFSKSSFTFSSAPSHFVSNPLDSHQIVANINFYLFE